MRGLRRKVDAELKEAAVVGREPSSSKASVIWRKARALSKGVTGMSPQSIILAQESYGLMLARGLKPRNEVWRPDAARIARGPNRAPGR